MSPQQNIRQLTAHLFRENSGKMVAVLSRMFGLRHIDTIMDIVQDSFETALTQWRFSGIPENPSGWLMQVARNKAVNALKKENRSRSFSSSVFMKNFDAGFEHRFEVLVSVKEIRDSQLRLLFTCCDPAFPTRSQVIITLHILCGFGVPEIASGLLMQEGTVKKTLARAKSALGRLDQILETRIITQSAERSRTVHTILYLMFNEGYKTTRNKKAINNDLCFEAIRLAKLLESDHREIQCESQALLALMFLNLSRFDARTDPNGQWLTLEEQDRSRWNRVFIEEGYAYLAKATGAETVSRYHIEAIIASLHCIAASFDQTDWKTIAQLYRHLEKLEPLSPHITLNRIIAESYLPGFESIRALNALETSPGMKDHFLVAAAKGHVYKRRGELLKAKVSYQRALDLSRSPADKIFLQKKINECIHLKN